MRRTLSILVPLTFIAIAFAGCTGGLSAAELAGGDAGARASLDLVEKANNAADNVEETVDDSADQAAEDERQAEEDARRAAEEEEARARAREEAAAATDCLNFNTDHNGDYVKFRTGDSSTNSWETKRVTYHLPRPELVKSSGMVIVAGGIGNLCNLADAATTQSWDGWFDEAGGSSIAYKVHFGINNVPDEGKYPDYTDASSNARIIEFRVWALLESGDYYLSSADTSFPLNAYKREGMLNDVGDVFMDAGATGLWDLAPLKNA